MIRPAQNKNWDDLCRDQRQRQQQMQLSDVLNTLKTSGFNNNRHWHLQSRRPRIIQQVAEAIHAETSLASQQRVPLLLREMGLQPQSAVDAGHAQTTKPGSINVLNEEVHSWLLTQLMPLRRTIRQGNVRIDTKMPSAPPQLH
jgi:hypothetical protein